MAKNTFKTDESRQDDLAQWGTARRRKEIPCSLCDEPTDEPKGVCGKCRRLHTIGKETVERQQQGMNDKHPFHISMCPLQLNLKIKNASFRYIEPEIIRIIQYLTGQKPEEFNPAQGHDEMYPERWLSKQERYSGYGWSKCDILPDRRTGTRN